MSEWIVYMVRCQDGSLYTGVTTDITRRVRQHNGDIAGGAKYTAARRPVQLVYQERCANRSVACQREWVIKKLSRRQKTSLIGIIDN